MGRSSLSFSLGRWSLRLSVDDSYRGCLRTVGSLLLHRSRNDIAPEIAAREGEEILH